MVIQNVLANVAVRDLDAAAAWYTRLLRIAGRSTVPNLVEWVFPRGGCLQVHAEPERAGRGWCTLAVSDLVAEMRHLADLGIEVAVRTANARVSSVWIIDPDGNHLAFSQAMDPASGR